MIPPHPADRWRRVEELLQSALDLNSRERDQFLRTACAGDVDLRQEVESLLAAHDRIGAVDRLASQLAPLAARVREAAAPLVGRTIGRYEVREQVGGGGMGVVYKAFDARLGRAVALKFLQPRFGADDSAAERFRREARMVAALEHPNICTVHEIGETDDGQLYLAMPLYDGETLQRRISRGPLATEDAVGIAVQIARGLANAHARGIVHRDIKPSNVLVTSDGLVKLLDFGIAKLADVTITGATGPLGTVAYMSPEQTRGAGVDHRTDLWSLGVVLYEMLTAIRPFPGEAAGAVINAIEHSNPLPPSTHVIQVPPALDRVVALALEKLPDARYQSASVMERDLLSLGIATASPGSSTLGSGDRPERTRWTGRLRRFAGRWHGRAAVVAVSLFMAAVALWLGVAPLRRSSLSGDVVPTIAVLPFVDRSPARDQEYFSDGIAEELIATLARMEGLRVASRTSSFAFKDRGMDIRALGAQLGVATVLEGSVRRVGNQLRITAQLVNVADGYQLWSETYDRQSGDAFTVQEEIARAIAPKLGVKLAVAGGTGDAERPDAQAYDQYLKGRHALYLRGRYAWYRRTEQGLRAAAMYFEQAVAQDPGYARAHSGLADAYAVLGFYDYLLPAEAFPKAERAARRAMELDAALGAPHATLGYVELYYHWNLRRAEEEFRRALALDPSYSTAHQWYANLLTAAGRFPEAERAMRSAEEIDPLSLIAKAALGWVFYHAGDYAAALEQFRLTLELNPEHAVAHLWRGWTLQAMDSLPGAVDAHRRALAASDSGALYVASLARSLALAGERVEAERLLLRLEARGDNGYVPSYEIAKVHDALGRPDMAFPWLEKARAQRSHSMVLLRVDPQLARLRTDPRFKRLQARVFPE